MTIDTRTSQRRPAASTLTRQGIPFARIVTTELRKLVDTRSGSWLVASVGLLALLATASVMLLAPDAELTYNAFITAVDIPMTLVLPVIAILSVSSEWSQRSGLTTFTLVPDRDRVIAAKAIACVGVAIASMPVAFGIGALGNVAHGAVAGVEPVWDLTTANLLMIALANVLSLLVGFTLGVLIRSSTGAIAAYFVFQFLLPALALPLAASQRWFRELQPWVDFDYAQRPLLDGAPTAHQWAHLGVTAVIWFAIPLAVGLRLVTRAEVH